MNRREFTGAALAGLGGCLFSQKSEAFPSPEILENKWKILLQCKDIPAGD